MSFTKTSIVAGALTVAAATFALVPSSPARADCGADHGAKAETAEAKADIVDTAVAAGDFETLVAAVKAAGLVDALKGEGPFTVFAPTDEAFAALPEGTVASLLKKENKNKLADILKYHVVSGKVMSKQAMGLEKATTLDNMDLHLKTKDGALMINDAKVVAADILASNGVIHVIDKVLLPTEHGAASR